MCRSLDELKQRGIEEGEMSGRIKILIQQLTSKLGNISKELILEIKKSDEERLNKLVIRIFDVNNEEDVYRILN